MQLNKLKPQAQSALRFDMARMFLHHLPNAFGEHRILRGVLNGATTR